MAIGVKFDQLVNDLLALKKRAEDAEKHIDDHRNQGASYAKRMRRLESENHALHKALDLMKHMREQDRKTIRLWQAERAKYMREVNGERQDSAAASSPSVELPSTSSTQAQIIIPELHETLTQQDGAITMSIAIESDDDDAALSPHFNDPLSSSPKSVNAAELPVSLVKTQPQEVEKDNVESISAQQEWHPTDFVVNPNYADQPFAFHEVTRGVARKCLRGHDCPDCRKFYETSNTSINLEEVSKHRDYWPRQETLVGFWRSDFPNTQESIAERKAMEVQRTKIAKERLREALACGRYLFRDPELRAKASAGTLNYDEFERYLAE